MAEPLRKDPYDRKFGEEDEQAVSGPDLRAIEGGGETTEPRRGHLSVAGKEKSKSPEELDEAEKGGGLPKPDDASEDEQSRLGETERQIGEGYQGGKNKSRSKFMSKFSGWSRRKKLLVGIGGGGGLIGAIVGIFMLLLPLKIAHIVQNLQNRYFGSTENIVSQRTEHLFSVYVQKHLIPGMSNTNCPGFGSSRTISKDCINPIQGENPAARLFRGWRDGRLENKLADNYGIEFLRSADNKFTLKVRGLPDTDLTPDFLTGNASLKDMGRNEFRQKLRASLNDAFEKESRWKRVLYRFKVGRLMERKYGIRRCLFFCKVTDKIDDWKGNKSRANKLMIVRRVVTPHSENLGLALECIISNTCGGDLTPDATDLERRTALENKIHDTLQRNGFTMLDDSVKKIADIVEDIDKSGGYTKYLIERVLRNFMTDQAAKRVANAAPVIGWILLGSQIIDVAANAGDNLKRTAFAINSAAMVGTFVMYRSVADEVKNGQADSELLGSMISSLGDTANDKGETAELSPLYGDILGAGSTKTSLLDFISPSAYAQGQANQNPTYTCDDENPIPAGRLICPEESLAAGNFLSKLSDAFNTPPLSYIAATAGAINGAISKGVSFWCGLPWVGKTCNLGTILWGLVPGAIRDNIEGFIESLLGAVAKWLIPSPVTDNMSGARAFNMVAGGANVAGNHFAHYGLGGQQLTDQQVAEIRNAQESKAREQFASQPFFARMFDSSTPYSFTSRVALALPSGYSTMGSSSFSSLVSDPFGKLMDGFGSLFGGRRGFAQATADPFGIPQFGYPLNAETEAIIKQNPDIYTDEYCAQVNKDWAIGEGQFKDTLVFDEATGIDIHTKPNPCLLEAAAVSAAGGYFTDEVFNKLDLSDPTPAAAATGGNNTGGGGGTASSCTLSRTQMVDQILSHQGGLLRLQNAGAQADQIQDPSKTTDRLICMLWSVLEQGKFKVSIGSIYRPNSGGSLHQQGRAIDFGDAGTEDPPGLFKWLYENKETLAIDELIFDPIPPGTNLVDQGNDCSTCYDQATLNAHRDHVHAGVLP